MVPLVTTGGILERTISRQCLRLDAGKQWRRRATEDKMILSYTVKMSAKERLKGESDRREVKISPETIDKLSDENAEILDRCVFGEKHLKKVQEAEIDEFDLCLAIISQHVAEEFNRKKELEEICSHVLLLPDGDLVDHNFTRGFEVRDRLSIVAEDKFPGATIPWDASEDMKAKRAAVEALAEAKNEQDRMERDKREREKEHEYRRSEERRRRKIEYREDFVRSLLDNVDKERREEGLLSDSEARGLILKWVLRQLPAFDTSGGDPVFVPAKGSEDLIDYERDCCHIGEFDCTWQSMESKSLSKEEYLDYKHLQKSIEMTETFSDERLGVEVEPKNLSYGCECDTCSERLVGIPGIKMSVTIGDWEISKLFLFRHSL